LFQQTADGAAAAHASLQAGAAQAVKKQRQQNKTSTSKKKLGHQQLQLVSLRLWGKKKLTHCQAAAHVGAAHVVKRGNQAPLRSLFFMHV
jgi:hypothetical protein